MTPTSRRLALATLSWAKQRKEQEALPYAPGGLTLVFSNITIVIISSTSHHISHCLSSFSL